MLLVIIKTWQMTTMMKRLMKKTILCINKCSNRLKTLVYKEPNKSLTKVSKLWRKNQMKIMNLPKKKQLNTLNILVWISIKTLTSFILPKKDSKLLYLVPGSPARVQVEIFTTLTLKIKIYKKNIPVMITIENTICRKNKAREGRRKKE